MTTTGLDLLGPGHPITLADGTTALIIYSFRSLALLESRFGSVKAVQGAIDSSGDRPAFGPLMQMIGAGLVGRGGFEPHIRERVTAEGERVVTDIVYRRRTDGVDLAELLHPGRLGEYSNAFASAFSAALKSPGNDVAPVVETVTIPSSPGTTSSISESVPSTFAPATSGT